MPGAFMDHILSFLMSLESSEHLMYAAGWYLILILFAITI
jgi:hypothetical protein